MKKFLIFFMVMFGMACSAMAEDYFGTQKDPRGGEGYCIMKPTYKDGKISYAVYFKTGEDKVSSDCGAEFADLKSELQNLYNGRNISYFVLVASADPQGDGKGYDNAALSKRRYDYVVKNVVPAGARIDDIGWVAGSATAKEFEPEYDANWMYRSVYIYPVWALQKCEQKTMNNINSAKSALVSAKAKYADKADEIQKALDIIAQLNSICKNSGDKLTPSDGGKYDRLLSELAGLMVGFVNFAPELQDVTQYITEYVEVTVYNTEIAEYYYNLAKIRDSLKVSAWRDAEGKFNTSRLISDSVAGVVLGTAGGLITSHLVKKNQLKKGFEDLNCSVGGQRVAGYGDDFRIGLQ